MLADILIRSYCAYTVGGLGCAMICMGGTLFYAGGHPNYQLFYVYRIGEGLCGIRTKLM